MRLPTSIASRRATRVALGVFVAGTAVAAMAAPALAATGPKHPSGKAASTHAPHVPLTLAEIQARGATAISRHDARLGRLDASLTKFGACDPGGKVAAEVLAAKASLGGVGTKLAADTGLATAKADAADIAKRLRAVDQATANASQTVACGHIDTMTLKASGLEAKLTTRVDSAPAGAGATAAKAALADMSAKLADAKVQADHASATLQGFVPNPGDKSITASNKLTLQHAHAQLALARADLKAAGADLRTIRADLRPAGTPAKPAKRAK